MIPAYVGLGGNLHNPRQTITSALQELSALPATHLEKHSALYASKALGPAGQPDYINAVAVLQTRLPALQLLEHLLEIEARHGRIRDGSRWGPRTLDLDLLLYGDLQTHDERLTLPHPRLHERNFVLYPLYEIAPQLVIPARGTLSELIKLCPPTGLVRLAN